MSSRIEYTPSDDAYIVPSDAETIATSERFGRQIEECLGMLDLFITPDSANDRWQIPFGTFGDETLTILTEHEHSDAILTFGYKTVDPTRGFRATGYCSSSEWQGKGMETYKIERVLRMLDANWPAFSIDNSPLRALVAKGNETSFGELFDLVTTVRTQYGTLLSSSHTFSQEWQWNDYGKAAAGTISGTIERSTGQSPTYRLDLTLPHEYAPNRRAKVTCSALYDEHFGTTYRITVDDPSCCRLNIALPDLIDLLDAQLQTLVEVKVGQATETLPGNPDNLDNL